MFKTTPTYYQLEIFTRSLHMPYAALFLEQGLGKSKIEIDTSCQLFQDGKLDGVVVISNKAVAENWYLTEVPKHVWDGMAYRCVLWGRNARSESELISLIQPSIALRIFCINVEALRNAKVQTLVSRLLGSGRFKIIVDESTLIKNSTAQQSRRCLSLAKFAAYTRILSGEPAPNGPMDLYHQYKFLSLSILPGFTKDKFGWAFCEMSEKWIGGRKISEAGKRFTPHGQALFEKMVGHCTYRLRKADVNDTVKFPEIDNQRAFVKMTEEQEALYNLVKSNVSIELRQILATDGVIRADVIVSKLIKLHQITSGFVVKEDGTIHPFENNPKMSKLLCLVLSRQTLGTKALQPTIIWCHYRHDVDLVTKEINKVWPGQAARIYGGITDNERMTNLENFMAGKVPILVANPQSIGHGLTLTAADTAIYYSNHYNYEYKVQSRDRIHRLGQAAETVHYVDIVMQNSVDEAILEALENKQGFCRSLFQSEWIQRVLGLPPVVVGGEVKEENTDGTIC